MAFTPRAPKAGPTGGVGAALPAGTIIFWEKGISTGRFGVRSTVRPSFDAQLFGQRLPLTWRKKIVEVLVEEVGFKARLIVDCRASSC